MNYDFLTTCRFNCFQGFGCFSQSAPNFVRKRFDLAFLERFFKMAPCEGPRFDMVDGVSVDSSASDAWVLTHIDGESANDFTAIRAEGASCDVDGIFGGNGIPRVLEVRGKGLDFLDLFFGIVRSVDDVSGTIRLEKRFMFLCRCSNDLRESRKMSELKCFKLVTGK